MPYVTISRTARPTTAAIIEDEEHVRVFLRLLLKQVGIDQVWEAGDGRKGLDVVAQHQPELVLLDINLPVMSGLEVLTNLTAAYPAIPVIMVSSQSAMSVVLETVKRGAAAYILKQSPPQEALKMLCEAIDNLESTEGDDNHH